jgi:hypothetical protein
MPLIVDDPTEKFLRDELERQTPKIRIMLDDGTNTFVVVEPIRFGEEPLSRAIRLAVTSAARALLKSLGEAIAPDEHAREEERI